MAIRVAVLEDQLLTREGIVRTLGQADLDVVAAVGDVPGLMRTLALDGADVVVLDVRLPPTFTDEGLRAAETIRLQYPEVAVLVLSQFVEAEFATSLLEHVSGGVGYLLKDRLLDAGTLADAVRRVGSGQCIVDPSLVADLMRQRTQPAVLTRLTPRERDVLAAMAEGLNNGAVGDRLGISPRTVEVHAQQVFLKLGITEDPRANRRVLAAVRYLAAVGND